MKDSNIPKFLSHDIPLFNSIITDLFPESLLEDKDFPELLDAIHNIIK